ncbi:MAG: hypothetical protein MJ200_02000 [Mycoplasmoidaceae bacterium]|nr:hypothetical protein [Mycoplasmoidaceae bacterium]
MTEEQLIQASELYQIAKNGYSEESSAPDFPVYCHDIIVTADKFLGGRT